MVCVNSDYRNTRGEKIAIILPRIDTHNVLPLSAQIMSHLRDLGWAKIIARLLLPSNFSARRSGEYIIGSNGRATSAWIITRNCVISVDIERGIRDASSEIPQNQFFSRLEKASDVNVLPTCIHGVTAKRVTSRLNNASRIRSQRVVSYIRHQSSRGKADKRAIEFYI